MMYSPKVLYTSLRCSPKQACLIKKHCKLSQKRQGHTIISHCSVDTRSTNLKRKRNKGSEKMKKGRGLIERWVDCKEYSLVSYKQDCMKLP